MRLTLRTLLAYLDDTLEPAQAKVIGQKVAESESARELIERIKQVTRRRRITTPPSSGPGSKIDPNTIADYLDNEVTPEQAEEVEQICLSSDVHLAEVAACHQILTLVLGEPLAVPPAAHQRMYGLLKGRDAITAKPAARPAPAPAISEGKEVDETLRLGLPALRIKDGWRNPLVLIGGGVVAAALLVVAIWKSLPGGAAPEPQDGQVVQVDRKDKKPDKTEPDPKAPEKKPDDADDKKPGDKKESDKDKDKDKKEDKPPPKDPDPMLDLKIPEVPFGPANQRESIIARYSPTDNKEVGILLQGGGGKSGWKRISAKSPEILTARPLVSMPGSKIAFQTNRNINVTLWANAPDPWAVPGNAPFRSESVADLHTHDQFDLEVFLKRGRILLTSTSKTGPVLVRIRFENPLSSGQEYFDVALASQGTKIMADYWTYFPVTEPFYKNPKNSNRVGPTAQFGLMALSGSLLVKHGDVTYNMSAPPGNAVIVWKSNEGPAGPFTLPKLPDLAPKIRPEMLKARDDLASRLAEQDVDVVLAEAVNSSNAYSRRLAVLCMGALNDLPGLLEALDQEKLPDLRQSAHECLRNWISLSRDNDYRLYDALKERYKGRETDIIMEMLHYTYFSPEEQRRPERYEILIDYLVNNTLVIRELAHWYLINLVPAGRNITYSASADSAIRARAETAWRTLIPPGQLPPKAGPPVKKG